MSINFELAEAIGWLGSVLLVLCAFPQALKVIRDGNTRGMSGSFIWMWTTGSAATLLYLIAVHPDATPIIAARVINFLPLLVFVWYCHRPRRLME